MYYYESYDIFTYKYIKKIHTNTWNYLFKHIKTLKIHQDSNIYKGIIEDLHIPPELVSVYYYSVKDKIADKIVINKNTDTRIHNILIAKNYASRLNKTTSFIKVEYIYN